MGTIWYSLAWKEWHEHKWKLVSISAIIWCVTLPVLYQSETDPFGLAAGMLTVCVIPLSVFVGLGAAANERSRGTAAFLQALPAPMWRVAMMKFLVGLVTVIIPIAFAVGLFFVCNQIFELVQPLKRETSTLIEVDNWFFNTFLFYSMVAASLFVWSAAAGVNRRDEVSAGAVALAVMVGWTTLLVLLVEKTSIFRDSLKLQVVALSTAPLGPMLNNMVLKNGWELAYLATAFSVTTVMHIILAGWYVLRFGQNAKREVRSPQNAVRTAGDWLAPPRRNWLTAVVWKQCRESGPVVLAGLAGVAGIVAVFVLPNAKTIGVHEIGQVLGAVTFSLGFAVALVVGIGVFLNDLTPQLNTFWRSRPIHPDGWFWTKLISGWIVFFASYSLPLLVAAFILWSKGDSELRTEVLRLRGAAVLAPLTIFACAVATTCLVRHAVYAAILSIPLAYSGIAIVWLTWQSAAIAGMIDWPAKNFVELSGQQFTLGAMISVGISTLLAWLAVRNDWGWKSRY